MNYLAHLFVSRPSGPSLVGNLMGDFLKGVNRDELPLEVQQGIETHFAVDRFTDRHPLIKELKMMFAENFRREAGITIDIAFDHMLINHWGKFTELAFSDFTDYVYSELERNRQLFSPAMEKPMGSMLQYRWLDSYTTMGGLKYVLDRLGERIRIPNRIAESYFEIERLYPEVERAFLAFFPDLLGQVFVDKGLYSLGKVEFFPEI